MTKRQRIHAKTAGRCLYCGGVLPEKGWHADHILPVQREHRWVDGGNGFLVSKPTGRLHRPDHDTEANLFPACASCNLDKSSNPIGWFRASIAHTVHTLASQRAFRFAKRYGLVEETGAKVVFWFETDEGRALMQPDALAHVVRVASEQVPASFFEAHP